jgi:hypothetical protein
MFRHYILAGQNQNRNTTISGGTAVYHDLPTLTWTNSFCFVAQSLTQTTLPANGCWLLRFGAHPL